MGISRPTGDARERIEYDLIAVHGESLWVDDAFWEPADSMTDDELTDALLAACGFAGPPFGKEERRKFRSIVVAARERL